MYQSIFNDEYLLNQRRILYENDSKIKNMIFL